MEMVEQDAPDALGAVATPRKPGSRTTCERPECAAPLTRPRQVRFCSAKCRTLWWEAAHPRVAVTHTKRQAAGSIWRAIFDEMARTESWYTVQQLAEIVGALPASVSTRLRTEVKAHAQANGYRWLRDHLIGHAGEGHRFRLQRAA